MTKQQFNDKFSILIDTFPELKITNGYRDKVIRPEFEDYSVDDFNRIIQYIYRTQLETPQNLIALMVATAKQLNLADPKEEINRWIKVIKSQQVFLNKGWDNKPPEVTCLAQSPDPRYYKEAVKRYKNKNMTERMKNER